MKDLDQTALQLSAEQAKARVALDVIRLVNRSDGAVESQLYSLATEFLVGYFGAVLIGEDD